MTPTSISRTPTPRPSKGSIQVIQQRSTDWSLAASGGRTLIGYCMLYYTVLYMQGTLSHVPGLINQFFPSNRSFVCSVIDLRLSGLADRHPPEIATQDGVLARVENHLDVFAVGSACHVVVHRLSRGVRRVKLNTDVIRATRHIADIAIILAHHHRGHHYRVEYSTRVLESRAAIETRKNNPRLIFLAGNTACNTLCRRSVLHFSSEVLQPI